jgi:uncharacterized protein YbjT (DUF2867 family)
MMNTDELVHAFRDVHAVSSVQNSVPDGTEAEVRQGKNVADAARTTGVQHIVYGSAGTGATGTGIGSWDSKLTVEAHIRTLGLPLTVLRPMAFMELMTDKDFYPSVSTWSLMPKLMGQDRPVGWICADDLGAIAARAFAEPDRFIGAELSLAADVQSIAQCRQIWIELNGRAPRRFPMPGTGVSTLRRHRLDHHVGMAGNRSVRHGSGADAEPATERQDSAGVAGQQVIMPWSCRRRCTCPRAPSIEDFG